MFTMLGRPNPFTLISFSILFADQTLDLVIEALLPEGASHLLILGWLGIARTIGPPSGITLDTSLFFILLTIIAIPFFWWYKRQIVPDTVYRAALAIFLGGLLGNLADGWRAGYPVDYLRVGVPFNLSDVAVILGGVLLVYRILRPVRAFRGE